MNDTVRQVSTTELPSYLKEFVTGEGGVLDTAKQAVAKPYEAYDKARVAGLPTELQQAYALGGGMVGTAQPFIDRAGATYDQQGNLLQTALPGIAQRTQGAVDVFNPYLSSATALSAQGLADAAPALGEAASRSRTAFSNLQPSLAEAGDFMRSAYGQFDPLVQEGVGMARTGLEQFSPYATEGAAAIRQGTGLGQRGAELLEAGAGAVTPDMISQYMNPFRSQVIDPTFAELDRQAAIAQTGRDAAATAAGAFGGSRRFLQDAEADRNLMDVKAQTLANLNLQGYDQAMGAAERELGRRMGAGTNIAGVGTNLAGTGSALANIGGQVLGAYGTTGDALRSAGGQLLAGGQGTGGALAGLAGQEFGAGTATAGQISDLAGQQFGMTDATAQRMLGAGSTASDVLSRAGQADLQSTMAGFGAYGDVASNQLALGDYARQAGLSDVELLSRIGGDRQAYSQRLLDSMYGDWQQQQAYDDPYRKAQFLSGIATGTPAGSVTTGSQTTPSPSTLSQVLGAGTALGGIAENLGIGWQDIKGWGSDLGSWMGFGDDIGGTLGGFLS